MLVALFILSTLGVGAWHAMGVSLRMGTHIRSSLTAGARLLQLDDQLRCTVGRVIPPFWAPTQIVEVLGNTLTVPYLDRNAEKSISMSFQDGVLTVSDGEHTMRYFEFKTVTFAAAADGQNQYGITVQLEADCKLVQITTRFGGAPAGKVCCP
ncbi:MAG: hypothetical protein ABSG21_11175 [Spirochaetia bacterium]